MHTRAQELIAELNLQPHPEGGFYSEIFRSPATVAPDDGRSARAALTTIYFLLVAGQQSAWHRVQSDEVWHFYEGDTLELLWLTADDTPPCRIQLGPVGPKTAPVAVVPRLAWQMARPLGAYTLVGCTVGPGFDFADFALLDADSEDARRMQSAFPDASTG